MFYLQTSTMWCPTTLQMYGVHGGKACSFTAVMIVHGQINKLTFCAGVEMDHEADITREE